MESPTLRQTEILNYIESRKAVDGGRSPSLRQIRRFFKFQSINAVQKHLMFMEKKGMIKTSRYAHRDIQIQPAGALAQAA